MASTTLLLPLPFGPTTHVTPRANSKRVRSAKLLKPNNSSDFSIQRTLGPLRHMAQPF